MNKVKVFYKIQTIILLAVMLCLVVCFTVGGTAFADTEPSILNLENCDKQLEREDLSSYSGVITDLDCIKQNKTVFADYIKNSDNKVLMTDRSDSNVLAYQLIGFSKEGIEAYPIFSYNKIDKSCVNYEDLINDDVALLSNEDKIALTSAKNAYDDYMSIDVSFCVYIKGYTGSGYNKSASVRMNFTIDYIPSDNPNYNTYVARYEARVTPTGKYTMKSFQMTPMFADEIYVNTYDSVTNHQAAVTTDSFGLDLGVTAQKGNEVSESGLKINTSTSGQTSVSFGYSTSYANGASSVIQLAENKKLDNFFGYPFKVTRSGRNNMPHQLSADKGKTYNGMYGATQRIRKDVGGGLLGFMFSDLDLWAQMGEPSYTSKSGEAVLLLASWKNDFSDKMIVAIESNDGDGQHYGDFDNNCSLPYEGYGGGLITFRENE